MMKSWYDSIIDKLLYVIPLAFNHIGKLISLSMPVESKPHCGHEMKSQRNSSMNSQHDTIGLIAKAMAANTDPTVPGDTLPPISTCSCVFSTCNQSILLIGTRKRLALRTLLARLEARAFLGKKTT